MRRLMMVCALACAWLYGYSQHDSLTAADANALSAAGLNSKRLDHLNKEMTMLDQRITKKTAKALRRLAEEEASIEKFIRRKDSLAGRDIFSNVQSRYKQLINSIESGTGKAFNGTPASYIPRLDTLRNSLKLLLDRAGKAGLDMNGLKSKLEINVDAFDALQDKLQQAGQVMEFIKLRKQLVRQTLEKYNDIPGSVLKSLKSLNKEAYYYGEEIYEYRNILNEPGKFDELIINIAKKIPAFSSFLEKNSQLAGIFSPAYPGRIFPAPAAGASFVSGLQARSSIQQLVQSRTGSAGNSGQSLQSQISQGMQQAMQIKEKFRQKGEIDKGELGSFKSNSQRTKSFWKRIEYSSDLQFGRPVNLLPATSDIALQAGYKLNDNSIIGVAAAYKLGLGQGWNKVRFTQEGIGFRSFINWRLKGSFYVQGNAEINYMSRFSSIPTFSAWQPAALLGITKKYRISDKIKGNFQVFYNFLHKSQVPNTQGFVFRTGYSL